MNPNSEREEQAIEALVSAALHVFPNEVSEADIERILASHPELSPEGRAALHRLGDDPLADIPPIEADSAPLELVGEFDAMHRSLSSDEVDEDLKARLAEKREEILRRIRERRKQEE